MFRVHILADTFEPNLFLRSDAGTQKNRLCQSATSYIGSEAAELFVTPTPAQTLRPLHTR